MIYENIKEGIFVSRPNRFIAQVIVDGKEEVVHVKNTGRCKELLVPGCKVYLQHFSSLKRKTAYDLISVYKDDLLINMDSQAPNKVFKEWLEKNQPYGEIVFNKSEYTYGESRLDHFIQTQNEKILVEIKGVTLENDGVVSFPDAPTIRGIKHINHLIKAKSEGYNAKIVFIVQMEKAERFTPNYNTHPEFAQVLKKAKLSGVDIEAYTCIVTPTSLAIHKQIPIIL